MAPVLHDRGEYRWRRGREGEGGGGGQSADTSIVVLTFSAQRLITLTYPPRIHRRYMYGFKLSKPQRLYRGLRPCIRLLKAIENGHRGSLL